MRKIFIPIVVLIVSVACTVKAITGFEFEDEVGFNEFIEFRMQVLDGPDSFEMNRKNATRLIEYIQNRKSNNEFRLSLMLFFMSLTSATYSILSLMRILKEKSCL